MYLYQVLMSYHDDDMDETDKYIHAALPDIEYKENERSIRDKKTGVVRIVRKFETVYTRLRNEVGHNRLRVTPSSTLEEMRHHLYGLSKLVKECIEHPPSSNS